LTCAADDYDSARTGDQVNRLDLLAFHCVQYQRDERFQGGWVAGVCGLGFPRKVFE
jgi:hypothetical protein